MEEGEERDTGAVATDGGATAADGRRIKRPRAQHLSQCRMKKRTNDSAYLTVKLLPYPRCGNGYLTFMGSTSSSDRKIEMSRAEQTWIGGAPLNGSRLARVGLLWLSYANTCSNPHFGESGPTKVFSKLMFLFLGNNTHTVMVTLHVTLIIISGR